MGNYDVKQKNIDLWTQWQNYLKSFYKLDTNTDTNANDIQTENITQKKSYNFDQSSYDPTGAGTVPWTQQLATHNKSPLGNSGTEGTQEKSLPDEYVKEMDRQKAFKTIIENFGALDNAGGTNFLGNDDKIVKKDLDEFLKKNPDLKTENPELYEAVNFLIENFEDYTDGWTLFNGKSISKEGMENTPDLPETDSSLWPDWDKDNEKNWPTPPPPHNKVKETWEEQKALNEVWAANSDIGTDGTKPPEKYQVENYLRIVAHEEGLDADSVVKEFTDKYLDENFYDGKKNWHEEVRNDLKTQKQINTFLDTALKEQGNGERGGNDNKIEYNDWYYKSKDYVAPWCATFVSWCADKNGMGASSESARDGIIPHYQGCWGGISYYKDVGRYHEAGSGYEPKAGDVFFHGTKHTGIILAYDKANNCAYTIEGNCDNQVKIVKRPMSYFTSFGSNGGTSSGVIPKNYDSTSGGIL